MNSVTQAQQNLATGTHSAVGEKKHFTWYDRLVLAAAGTVFTMFQIPVGQAGRTLADTNMTMAGVLPSSVRHRVRAIIISYAEHAIMAAATLDLLMIWIQSVTVSLTIQGKAPSFQFPLAQLLGQSMLIHCTGAATLTDVLGTVARANGIFPLNIPITLAANTNFNVTVEYPAALGAVALVGDFLKIGLDGITEQLS